MKRMKNFNKENRDNKANSLGVNRICNMVMKINNLMNRINKEFNKNSFKMYLMKFKIKIHLKEKEKTKIKIKDLIQMQNIKLFTKILRNLKKIISKTKHKNLRKVIKTSKMEKEDDRD
mgnify:FL=1